MIGINNFYTRLPHLEAAHKKGKYKMFKIEDDRSELYAQDWLGEELEIWLDKIEDSGIWDMKKGEVKKPKRKTGATVTCLDVTISEGDETVKRAEYEMSIPNNDVIQMIYLLELHEEGDVEDKKAYYNDEDDNDIPTQNFHWSKWKKAF